MWNRTLGKFYFENGATVDRTFNLEQFQTSPLADEVMYKDRVGECANLTVTPRTIMGLPFSITFTFEKSDLKWIALSYSGMEDIPYDQANEMRRKAVHDEWLFSLYGEPHRKTVAGIEYQLPWGTVQSNFDPRSVQSAIYIAYK